MQLSHGLSNLAFKALVEVMKSAANRFSMQKISSILRYSSGWRAIGMYSDVQATCTEDVHGFDRSDGSVRGYVATSPLLRSFISSKYSRNESKRVRNQVVEVKHQPVSKVRHGPNLAFKALNHTGLLDSTKAVILGSLLGDSTLDIAKGKHTRICTETESITIFNTNNDTLFVIDRKVRMKHLLILMSL